MEGGLGGLVGDVAAHDAISSRSQEVETTIIEHLQKISKNHSYGSVWEHPAPLNLAPLHKKIPKHSTSFTLFHIKLALLHLFLGAPQEALHQFLELLESVEN
jgi:hypothetical protein